MNFELFQTSPFIQSIAENNRWTVSTNKKMPIDMVALRDESALKGASFKDGNYPLVTLPELISILPNATNTAYNLRQSLDNFVVLDIEPRCPEEIRDELLTLPYKYLELSMSGKGFHLVFDTPKTEFNDIVLAKPSLQEEHGYYEILLNHYVTFTGTLLQPSELCVFQPLEKFEELFNSLASKATILREKEVNTDELPDIDDIPLSDDIVSVLSEAKFPKTLEDYQSTNAKTGEVYDDYSKFEFGLCGFYYKKLNMLLSTTKYSSKHDYSDEEKIVLLHEVISEKLPYRPKHETYRYGLPWLLFTCKRVVATGK